MPFLLAMLGPAVGDHRREVTARGRTTADEVSDDVLKLPDGAVVLLQGKGGRWRNAAIVKPGPWPSDLGAFEELVASKQDAIRVDIQSCATVRGQWLLDPTGRPVEHGLAHIGGRTILNYAGWRISDFPSGEIEVVVATAPRGTVLVVPPRSVPTPARELVPRRPEVQSNRKHSVPREVGPVQFKEQLRFVDLEFLDGSVTFRVSNRKMIAHHEKALALHQDVRKELDVEQPAGVTVQGELRPDGTYTTIVTGLDSLDRVFARVQHGRFVRKGLASQDWLSAEDLAKGMPSGGGEDDPVSLIDVEEFGFRKRAEAYRRLFRHRDRSTHVFILPGRAVIVPIAAPDGGARFYAWEVVTNDFATYLFQPADDSIVGRMLDWTRDPEQRRRELLADKDLKRELGFVKRVIHDGYEHDLAPWWNKICEVTGINPAEGEARA